MVSKILLGFMRRTLPTKPHKAPVEGLSVFVLAFELIHADGVGVLGDQGFRRAAQLPELFDELGVDFVDKHVLHHPHGVFVRYAKSLDEIGGDPLFLHGLGNVLAAAVHHHRAHAHGAHEGDVFEDPFVHAGFRHGGSAVLDDDDAVSKLLDVRQSLDEDLGFFNGFFHFII